MSNVLFVVGVTPMIVDDEVLETFLRTALGHNVTVRLDGDAEDLTGIDLVVISESCNSGSVGTKYRDAAVPAIVLENGNWDEFYFGTSSSTVSQNDTITIVDEGSQVAAGYINSLSVYTSVADMKTLDDPAAGINVVANASDGSPNIFTVEQGHILTSGTAPARRVGMGWKSESHENWSAEGFDIFTEAVLWALGESVSRTANAALVVGDPVLQNQSEKSIRTRLRMLGFNVDVVDDANITTTVADSAALVVMSKTVDSGTVGSSLRDTTSPVIFWEDNQQQMEIGEQFNYLATIDQTNTSHTSWHGIIQDIYIDDSAPIELKAGLSGLVSLYQDAQEMTWAPLADGATFGPGAITIAERSSSGDNRWPLYVYEAGGMLADGTSAVGKRAFFGLYDDTFIHLSEDGVTLFDAMVSWSVGLPLEYNFDGTDGEPWPADWTTEFDGGTDDAAIDIQGNRGRMQASSTPWSVARAEISGSSLGDIRWEGSFESPSNDECYPSLIWRASPDWGNEGTSEQWNKNTGYSIMAKAYSDEITLNRLDNGLEVDISTIAMPLSQDVTYNFIIEHEGSDIRVKVWPATDAEPSTWDIEATDDTYDSGEVAVSMLGGGSSSVARTWFLDDFVISDKISGEAESPIPTPTNVQVTVTSRTSATITWDDVPEADQFQVEARVRAGVAS